MSNALNLSIPIPIAQGGTNAIASVFAANRVIFINSGNTAFSSSSGLTFDSSINNLATTTFTGALAGNATTSTTATNATNAASNFILSGTLYYPVFITSNTNSNQPLYNTNGISFNPSSNTLTTNTFTGTNFIGNLTGPATKATTVSVTTNASYYPLFVPSSTNSNQIFNLGTGLSYNPSTNILSTTGVTLTGNLILSGTSQSINFYNSQLGNFYTDAGTTLKGSIGPGRSSDLTLSSVTGGNWLRLGSASGGKISFWIDGNVGSNDSPNMNLSSSGLYIADLSTSKGVFTDGSSNLTSTGTLGIAQGGTNQTTYAATVSGATSIIYYNGSTTTNGSFGAGSDFTYNSTQGIISISSNSVNPGVSISTTSSSGVVTYFSASRFSATQGNAEYRLLSGGTDEWNWGTYGAASNNQDLVFSSTNGANVVMTMGYSTGNISLGIGNLIFSTATKGLQLTHAAVSAGTANSVLVTGIVLTTGSSGTINNSAITTSHLGFVTVTTRGGTATTQYQVTCGSGTFSVSGGSLDTSTLAILFVKSL